LLIFTDMGRVYGLRAWETPSASRYGRGSHIRNLLGGIREEEKVISILPSQQGTHRESGEELPDVRHHERSHQEESAL